MKVLDPGHDYELRALDTWGGHNERLTFVKREGPGYPGNEGSHGGTTTQEVLRALIDRAFYVDGQISDDANALAIHYFRASLWALERRAATRHGRIWSVPFAMAGIENLPTCEKCNHIGCEGTCHAS